MYSRWKPLRAAPSSRHPHTGVEPLRSPSGAAPRFNPCVWVVSKKAPNTDYDWSLEQSLNRRGGRVATIVRSEALQGRAMALFCASGTI